MDKGTAHAANDGSTSNDEALHIEAPDLQGLPAHRQVIAIGKAAVNS